MKWDAFLDELAQWLELRDLLRPEDVWVIGVSGGPDSTLLLHAMRALSLRQDLGWKVHVAHFNHGLRGPEADADEQFVAALAEELALPFHVGREDIRSQVEQGAGSTEEIARRHRYVLLERIALKAAAEKVAVAHHADDNVETVLHRICRGTGLRGLGGITEIRPIQPGSRVSLVRPLLDLRRSTIEELCASQGFASRRDSSNASGEFTRNRIRNDVLPLLREKLNPNVNDALLRLSEQARWLGGYLEEAAARTFESLVISDSPTHVALRTSALLGKHQAIQSEVVRRAIAIVAGGEQELTFAHIQSVLRLARNANSGKSLHLPGRVVCRKQYERLEFGLQETGDPPPELPPILVLCPGETALPALGADLIAEVCEVDPSKIAELRAAARTDEEWLDVDRLTPPLVVRGRRPGDRFHPLGAPGAKSLGDFLSDVKVDPQDRARIGLLCDQNGPVWVMPLRIDERAKLTPGSRRALRVQLRPTNAARAD